MDGTGGDNNVSAHKINLSTNRDYMIEIEKIASVPRYIGTFITRVQTKRPMNLLYEISAEEKEKQTRTENTLIELHQKYEKLDNDIGPGDFIGQLLVDLLTRKFQLAQRLPFTYYPNNPSVRKILEIDRPDPNARFIMLPVVNHISAKDIEILDGIEKFIDTLSTKKYWLLDCDLDTFAIKQRHKAIYYTPNPVSKSLLFDDPLEKFFQEDEDKKKQQSNIVGPTITHQGGNVFSRNSSFIVPNGDNSADDSERSEDEIEEFTLPVPMQVYHNMYGDNIDQGIAELHIQEEDYMESTNEFREGFIPGNEDDGYDKVHGYFLGTSLLELYTDDVKTMDKLTGGTLKNIYKRLDVFDSDDIFDDINFDIARYSLGTKPNGEVLYHWDVLARETGLSVDVWQQMINRGIISQDCMAETDPQKFIYIPNHIVTDKTLEFKVLKYNVRIYKKIFAHPWFFKDFENRKYYHDTSKYKTYPNCMFHDTIITNRHERWTAINEISKDEKRITEMMLKNDEVHSFGYLRSTDSVTGRFKITQNTAAFERLGSSMYDYLPSLGVGGGTNLTEDEYSEAEEQNLKKRKASEEVESTCKGSKKHKKSKTSKKTKAFKKSKKEKKHTNPRVVKEVDFACELDCTAGAGQKAFFTGLRALKPKAGTLVVQGNESKTFPDFPMEEVTLKYVTIKSARGHSYLACELAMQQLASHRFPIENALTHTFSLGQVDLAIRSVGGTGEKDCIHVNVKPWKDFSVN